MGKLTEIKKPVQTELEEFNRIFAKELSSKVPLLNIITRYVLKTKGKQVRPLLVMLTAHMIGKINKATYTAASLIELLHTATLVHDDVVDEANERRGFLSINALWKSKIAVLMGDYLLSKGLLIAIRNEEFEQLKIVSEAVEEMSEGELLQLQKARQLNTNENDYLSIIQKKTATLLAACTKCGAHSVSNDPAIHEKMYQFGLNLGLAFQIKDDLFDYETNTITGKPQGNDIKEKKMTLPLILALEETDAKKRRYIKKLISNKSEQRKTVSEIITFVHANNGYSKAHERMLLYRDKAIAILHEFPENESRKALCELTNYIVERKK